MDHKATTDGPRPRRGNNDYDDYDDGNDPSTLTNSFASRRTKSPASSLPSSWSSPSILPRLLLLLLPLLLTPDRANSVAVAAVVHESSNSTKEMTLPTLHSLITTYESTSSLSGIMFDVHAKAKNNISLVIYGMEINVAYFLPSSSSSSPTELRALIYSKEGTHANDMMDKSSWKMWMNVSFIPNDVNTPTYVPQKLNQAIRTKHLALKPGKKMSFYVNVEDGPYLRHVRSIDDDDDGGKLYYQDEYLVIGGTSGHAKRANWDGSVIPSRTFSGGVHYYLGEMASDIGGGVVGGDGNDDASSSSGLLPGIGLVTPDPTSEPSSGPTTSPTTSSPTTSVRPSSSPTDDPTIAPTKVPTDRPTQSPIDYDYLITTFETGGGGGEGAGNDHIEDDDRPVLVSAGQMFDVKARNDIEISSLGFNTHMKTKMNVLLYVRRGSHVGYERDMDGWTLCANLTVSGTGTGNPTYVPYGSFEPLMLKRMEILGVYLTTTDGPYIRASYGDGKVGTPMTANPDLVLYEGIGKRYPMEDGDFGPCVFNGVFQYVSLVMPTNAPTIDVSDLWVANVTLKAVADAYVDRDDPDGTFGDGTRLKVDGVSEKVSLIQFDLGILEGQTGDAPSQVLKATLRLYSIESKAMFGGYVSVIPNGKIDERTASWNTVPYADVIEGTYVGRFRSVWPMKFYDIDLTSAFRGRNTIPRGILVRISSDQDNGVVYRSRNKNDDDNGGAAGMHPNGPRLTVDFAYDPDTNKALARSFGSDPPTPAPTVLPKWEDARVPTDVTDKYFNYNPGTFFGPNNWENVEGDEWYDRLRGLDADTRRNRCNDGSIQSPRDLCDTNDECIEWHQPRPRVSWLCYPFGFSRSDYSLIDC
jgi:hypothetical protein